jgi:hypothetical protein
MNTEARTIEDVLTAATALAERFDRLHGQTLLGAVDGVGAVELIFDVEPGVNLVTVDLLTRSFRFGQVVDPRGYAAKHRAGNNKTGGAQ